MIEGEDIVRDIHAENENLLVTFMEHAAYFQLPASDKQEEFKDKLMQSKASGEKVSFGFDADMNILKVG